MRSDSGDQQNFLNLLQTQTLYFTFEYLSTHIVWSHLKLRNRKLIGQKVYADNTGCALEKIQIVQCSYPAESFVSLSDVKVRLHNNYRSWSFESLAPHLYLVRSWEVPVALACGCISFTSRVLHRKLKSEIMKDYILFYTISSRFFLRGKTSKKLFSVSESERPFKKMKEL